MRQTSFLNNFQLTTLPINSKNAMNNKEGDWIIKTLVDKIIIAS